MSNSPKKRICILIVIISIVFSHLAFSNAKAHALSIEDEMELGQEFLKGVKRAFPFVEDDYANKYFTSLGNYLFQATKSRPFPLKFYIIKDDTVNAFAGPGGQIFFFTGLIEAMDEIDEVASVLCHEIAHVSARHLAKRMEQGKKIQLATLAGILAGSLIGGKAAGPIVTGSLAAGIQTQLNYSREDERQADQLGYEYMCQAGLKPEAIISALSNLSKNQWYDIDKKLSYLLTHPVGTERIANIESLKTSFKPESSSNYKAEQFRKAFPLFKTILRAQSLAPVDAERIFTKDLKNVTNTALANFGLGIVWKNKSELTKAIEHFEKALIEMPDSLPVLRYLGESYQQKGRDQDAIKIFNKALKKNRQDNETLFLLALSYQNIDDYYRSISILKRLVLIKPVKDKVFYNLGISYGKNKELGFAHYYFGLFYKRKKMPGKAQFHFEIAQKNSIGNASLTKKIDEAMEGNIKGAKEEKRER